LTKREFKIENEYPYNRSGPMQWIWSHMMRYPLFPLILVVGAVLNNMAYSQVQINVGRGFDVITTPGWTGPMLLAVALSTLWATISQSATGLLRNYASSFMAELNRARRARRVVHQPARQEPRRSTGGSASAISWRAPPTTCGCSTRCSAPA
jgi:hypothetical protein